MTQPDRDAMLAALQNNAYHCFAKTEAKSIVKILESVRAASPPAAGELEELKSEQRLFDEDLADKQRTLDRIAELIGLPHDQEIDATAFELWFDKSATPAAGSDPVAWRYQRKGWGEIWRCTPYVPSFDTPDDWTVQPLYVAAQPETTGSDALREALMTIADLADSEADEPLESPDDREEFAMTDPDRYARMIDPEAFRMPSSSTMTAENVMWEVLPDRFTAARRDAARAKAAAIVADVREECAKLIESGAGMADLIDQDDLDQQAKIIRALTPDQPK